MNFGATCISLSVISFVFLGCLFSFTQSTSDTSIPFTLIYAGEERGQLGLRGCGTEQVGGLSRRQSVIRSLREKHFSPLNLHTRNILDPINSYNELNYQIALESLSEMHFGAVCLGRGDLRLPIDSLSAHYANHPDLPVVCTNIVGARLESSRYRREKLPWLV